MCVCVCVVTGADHGSHRPVHRGQGAAGPEVDKLGPLTPPGKHYVGCQQGIGTREGGELMSGKGETEL